MSLSKYCHLLKLFTWWTNHPEKSFRPEPSPKLLCFCFFKCACFAYVGLYIHEFHLQCLYLGYLLLLKLYFPAVILCSWLFFLFFGLVVASIHTVHVEESYYGLMYGCLLLCLIQLYFMLSFMLSLLCVPFPALCLICICIERLQRCFTSGSLNQRLAELPKLPSPPRCYLPNKLQH